MTVFAKEYLEQGSGIITLCGSTRFFFEYMEASRKLTFLNWMVFTCGSFGHSFHKYAKEDTTHDYAVVKKLHFQKILESDAIVIVTDDTDYIGESTKAEINFCNHRGIPYFWFINGEFTGATSKAIPNRLEDTSLIDAFAKNHSLGF